MLRSTELLYSQEQGIQIFIDLEKKDIVTAFDDMEESEKLILVPTIEELVSYNDIMYDFLEENQIDVPRGMGASRYLRETQQMTEFYSFREEAAEKALDAWLVAKNISLD